MSYEEQVRQINSKLPLDKSKEPRHVKDWPTGTIVKFEPRGFLSGDSLLGEVVGHIYDNVLIVVELFSNREWFVSTNRCCKF